MSDTDYSVNDFIADNQRMAKMLTYGAMDEDPEQATRAIELGDSSGVPASAIYGNVDSFEKKYKAALQSDLIQHNPHLANYLVGDPMAARVSNDDLGNLDELTQQVNKGTGKSRLRQWLDSTSVSQTVSKSFMEGFGDEPVSPTGYQEFYQGYSRPNDVEWALSHPALSSVLSPIGRAEGLGEIGVEALSRTTNGLINLGHDALSAMFGKGFADEMAGEAQYAITRGDIATPGFGGGAKGPLGIIEQNQHLVKTISDVSHALDIAEPWSRIGEDPPVGLHPLIDKAKELQAKEDADWIDKSLSAAAKSATRERSPELFAQFLRGQVGNREIGIDPEAIAKLYGDKPPAPDDNILGWIPGLAESLEAAKATGADVTVPLADYLAKVDPDIAKELHDFIRVRDKGVTIDEAKIEAEPKTAIPDPVASIRASAGLEPIYAAAGDRKVTLSRKDYVEENARELAQDTGRDYDQMSPEDQAEIRRDANRGSYNLDMLDETGKQIGSIKLSEQKGGKQLYIQMIRAGGTASMYDPNFLGPALIRDLKRQLKSMFPNAETLTGYRVTGAREKAGEQAWMAKSALSVVKLDLGEDPQGFRDLLSPYWTQIGPESFAYTRPEWSPRETQIANAVAQEAERLAPGIDVQTVHKLLFEAAGNGVRGLFNTQTKQMFISLESKAGQVGIVRHEVVHWLRSSGLFSEGEWLTLARAAHDQNWIERYNISARYKNFDPEAQLEEAIAEGYRHWAMGEGVTKDTGVFQKIKDFFEGIYRQVKQVLGKDFTWEELFKEIDAGRVGRREGEDEGLGQQVLASSDLANDIAGPESFQSPRHAKIRLDQLLRDKAQSKKLGDDVESTDYMHYNVAIRRLREYLKQSRDGGSGRVLASAGEGEKPSRGPMAREVAPQHLPWYDKGFRGEPRGGNEAEQAAWDRGKLDASNAERQALAGPSKPVEQPSPGPAAEQPTAKSGEAGEEEPFGLYSRGKALGVTDAHMERMHDLIRERNEKDFEASQRRAEVRQRRRSNKDWKERRTVLRDEVREQMSSRPDLALDAVLTKYSVKIDPAYLSEDQRSRLPKDYLQKKNGVNPDDLAPYFGFTSGDAMVERLGMLTEERRRAGMSQRDYLNRSIDVETDRRLNQEFGDRDKHILDEAKDQALSETQLRLVHEETMQFAVKAGQEPQFTLDQTRAMVRQAFDSVPVGQIKSDKLLQNAGKLGKKIEEAGSKGDWAEAYRLSQQRNHTVIAAKMARDYEKARASLDRTAKSMGKREPPSVTAEYANWIHDMLSRVGYRIQRLPQDLAENIGRQNEKTIGDFKSAKEAEWSLGGGAALRELPIAGWILDDPAFKKPIDELTHSDFMAFKGTIDGLVKAGRDEKKIYAAGEVADRAAVMGQMMGQLGTFKMRAYKATVGAVDKFLKLPRSFFAGQTVMETLLNRWDRGDALGVFNRYITYPLAKASNYKNVLERDAADQLKALGRPKDLNKTVASPFNDHLTRTEANPDGEPYSNFTRNNVLAMLQNAGNKSNWTVLAKGFGEDPAKLWAWLEKNVTQDDIDRAQKLGGIFQHYVKLADSVYERLTGATVQKIPLEPVTFNTREGPVTMPGWYHPLIKDSRREEVWEKDDDTGIWTRRPTGKRGSVDDGDYFHASTSNGYTMKRTGATYPLELNFDMVPARLQQMIHDIAYREVLLETNKIFSSKAFRAEVLKHYGEEYRDLLEPYLHGIAGAESIPSKALAGWANLAEVFRQNVISSLIAFNPYTALKHGPTALVMSSREVGPVKFANALMHYYGKSPDLTMTNSKFAMTHSEELQRRERHWQEAIRGQLDKLGIQTNPAQAVRNFMMEKGAWLVAKSDMMSAKPTWTAAFNEAIAAGNDFGTAVQLGDRAVRRAHGSTAATNQPLFVSNKAGLQRWFTSVYGFFGTNMQRRIEIAHDLNDTYQLGRQKQWSAAAAHLPGLLADVMTYVVWPTIVEEAVTGLTTQDKKGWGQHLAAGAFLGLSTSVLYLRDLVQAVVHGRDVSAGLLGAPFQDVANVARDFGKGNKSWSRQNAGRTVGHMLNLIGDGTGMAPHTLNNAVKFGIDLVNHQAHPHSPMEVFRGATRGQTQRKVER
jgi:hypothetical protein